MPTSQTYDPRSMIVLTVPAVSPVWNSVCDRKTLSAFFMIKVIEVILRRSIAVR